MAKGKLFWIAIIIAAVAIIGMLWTDAVALAPINESKTELKKDFREHKSDRGHSSFDCGGCESFEERLADIDSEIAPIYKQTIFNSALIVGVAGILIGISKILEAVEAKEKV